MADLSPAMVWLCALKGLDAYVSDFLNLPFATTSFDAIYAMNCLLHVPNVDLDLVLRALQDLLRPGGLLYVGLYAGPDKEGVMPDDDHEPPRFFSWRSNELILTRVAPFFDVADFHTLNDGPWTFQSLTLMRHPSGLICG